MILQCNEGGDFKPHPEGIHPGLCLDVIDLGLVKTEYQGQERIVPKVKLVFESEQKTDDGRNCTVSKNFTASLHPKAKLADFIGKWRGRPVLPGESIDLSKLIGACCTLVISHQQNLVGKTYASIDAISKPTKKLVPSGHYDPAAARQRIAEWKAKQAAVGQRSEVGSQRPAAPARSTSPQPSPESGEGARPPVRNVFGGSPNTAGGTPALPKSPAPLAAPAEDNIPFDPEVGF